MVEETSRATVTNLVTICDITRDDTG